MATNTLDGGNDLGTMIVAERARQGWTQADLARRMGLGQQTVSRWERGRSRPERPMVARLSEALGLPVRALLEAAGYASPLSGRRVAPLPVRPLVEALPLDQLPPDRFEQFCTDLVAALRPDAQVNRAGSQGHTQGGLDLVARLPDGTVEAFQVKRHRTFGPAKVLAAVQAAEVKADRYVLLLARRAASPQAREEAARHDWQLWDAEDVSRLIRFDLERDAAIRLVDIYFPNWREPFLGEPSPGPWRTTEETFRQRAVSPIYTHEHALVGRVQLVDEFMEWVQNPASPVSVLLGRGGLGKTRLLRSVATRIEAESGMRVRFLDPHASVSPRDIELLPESEPLLVVVDDVHDRDDVSLLVATLLRARPDARVLLSLRPYGVPPLTSALREAGLRFQDLPQWKLDDLSTEEAEQLAASILGADSPVPARQLGNLTRDCPLITVLAAELLRRGDLQPWDVHRAEDLRHEVLSVFSDVAVRSGDRDRDIFRRHVLDAVAALQPLRTRDETFRSAMQDVLTSPWDRIERELRDLEDAGVLLRRGGSLRIVPDLLGDAVLAEACFDRGGLSTGFVERVFTAVAAEPRQHVFVNANRVDWRVRQRVDVDGSVSAMLWGALHTEFAAAGIWGRSDLLKLVERSAAYAPAPALELVQWAIDNPTEEVDDHLLSGLLPEVTYTRVLEDIPPILRNLAYSFAHLPDALNLLWRLALDDSRPINQHPDHPIRILSELAEYEPGKPLAYNEAVIEAAAVWLREGPESEHHSPFDVLEPLLASEGADETATARAVVFRPFRLDPKRVERLRSRVVDLALKELCSPDPRRAVRAARAVEHALRGPTGMFGRTVTDEERAQWAPVFAKTLDDLHRVATSTELDPVVWIAIKEAVSWHATWSKTKTKPAAQQLLAKAPTSPAQDLTEALLGRDRCIEDVEDDYAEVERKRQARLAAVASRLVNDREPEKIVRLLEERLATIARAFDPLAGEPGALMAKLVELDPAVAEALYHRISSDPDSACLRVVPAALSVKAEVHGEVAVRDAQRLLQVGTVQLDRHVAHALGWGRGRRSGFLTSEAELLRKLAKHDDTFVRRAVVRAAQVRGSEDPGQALDLLLSVPFADSRDVADEFLGSFGRRGEFSWEQLDGSQVDTLLAQLRQCPSLDGHDIHSALVELSALQPWKVLLMLEARVETKQQGLGGEDYRALPFQWHQAFKFRHDPDFPKMLEHLRDWVASDSDNYWRQKLGAELFRTVAGPFDDEVVRVLREGVSSGDENCIRAVGSILGEAPEHLVWDAEFVSTVLEAAQRHCPECLRHVVSELHSAAVSGLRHGTPGQPFPEDIRQKEDAEKRVQQLPAGSAARRFYEALRDSAARSIDWAYEDDAQLIDGRDW